MFGISNTSSFLGDDKYLVSGMGCSWKLWHWFINNHGIILSAGCLSLSSWWSYQFHDKFLWLSYCWNYTGAHWATSKQRCKYSLMITVHVFSVISKTRNRYTALGAHWQCGPHWGWCRRWVAPPQFNIDTHAKQKESYYTLYQSKESWQLLEAWFWKLDLRFSKILSIKAWVEFQDIWGFSRNSQGLSWNFPDQIWDFRVLKAKGCLHNYFFTLESEHKLLIKVNFLNFNTVGFRVF